MTCVLVISSGGGHWQQAQLLNPALPENTIYVRASRDGAELPDCSLKTIWRVPGCLYKAMRLMLSTRPDVVLSTGALPGLIGILAGKLIGAKTVWIDSVANAQRMSLSGRAAKLLCKDVFSQWPDVARRTGTRYAGSVI